MMISTTFHRIHITSQHIKAGTLLRHFISYKIVELAFGQNKLKLELGRRCLTKAWIV